MKIFWSWQSDTSGKTGRYFVRDALLDAIKTLRQPEDIEGPTKAKNRESMHLDQDRQSVTGSPALTDTIKRKSANPLCSLATSRLYRRFRSGRASKTRARSGT